MSCNCNSLYQSSLQWDFGLFQESYFNVLQRTLSMIHRCELKCWKVIILAHNWTYSGISLLLARLPKLPSQCCSSEQASQWHEMYCLDLEVMSSNPSWVELWVYSTSNCPKSYFNQKFLYCYPGCPSYVSYVSYVSHEAVVDNCWPCVTQLSPLCCDTSSLSLHRWHSVLRLHTRLPRRPEQ